MKFRARLGVATLIAASLAGGIAAADDAKKSIAVFDVNFIDSSTEGDINGVRQDEVERLKKFDVQLREKLEEAGYELVDLAPVGERIERTLNTAQCNGCAVDMGKELNADLVVTSEIQKVSNLILAINIAVYDVETENMIRIGSADIRGNDDRSWLRGQKWLLENRILTEKP